MLEVEFFNCWGINFIGSFPSPYNNNYIIVAVDYVSKLFEAVASPNVDSKTMVKLLKKNISAHF